MNTDVLGRRFADFKSRFSQLFGNKNDGYDELDTLERPLVSAVDGDDTTEGQDQEHVGDHADGREEEETRARQRAVSHVPSQYEELGELTVLSKDAAEILWEMVVMGTQGSDVEEMRGRAEQLRAQLRGMLNDYDGGDEVLMCNALEAFDSLNAALEGDVQQAEANVTPDAPPEASPEAPPEAPPEADAPPPVAAETEAGDHPEDVARQQTSEKKEEELPPLISF
ncbi:hypothetical protein M9434_006186 [Picochlorum sp. BPE23]|nr:hypothetical protein M9434_006186 [Picochlorum sp. BPE23]